MADDTRQSGTDRYFVDLDSGMVHVKDHKGRSFEADNLDEATNLTAVNSPEQINDLLGGKPGKACKRCFPNPSAAEKAFSAEGPHPRQTPPGVVDEDETMEGTEYDAIEALGPAPMTAEDEEAERTAGHD